jgi:chlorite dismutase
VATGGDAERPSTTPPYADLKADVRERGAGGQYVERRLFMQLQVFTGCADPKPLVTALERSRLDAVLYDDINDPRGVGVLAMSEDPVALVGPYRDLLNAEPFAGLSLRSELTMLGRTYASGFEQDLEEWLFRRPRRTVLNPAWPWAIW